ncbi:hypothetical protein ACJX0J_005621 [Zea mays]
MSGLGGGEDLVNGAGIEIVKGSLIILLLVLWRLHFITLKYKKLRVPMKNSEVSQYEGESHEMYKKAIISSNNMCHGMRLGGVEHNYSKFQAIIMHDYPFKMVEHEFMQKRIICLTHVKGHHTGEILAHEFVKGVMDWNLENSLFSLTLDNAATNNKCVRVVVKELNNLAKLRKCLCHILNLNIRAVIVIVKNSTKCAEPFGLDNKNSMMLLRCFLNGVERNMTSIGKGQT